MARNFRGFTAEIREIKIPPEILFYLNPEILMRQNNDSRPKREIKISREETPKTHQLRNATMYFSS